MILGSKTEDSEKGSKRKKKREKERENTNRWKVL